MPKWLILEWHFLPPFPALGGVKGSERRNPAIFSDLSLNLICHLREEGGEGTPPGRASGKGGVLQETWLESGARSKAEGTYFLKCQVGARGGVGRGVCVGIDRNTRL